MRFNTFVSSIADIEAAAQAINVGEVLIEPTILAREGTISLEKAGLLAHHALAHNLRPILVWDALMPERTMQSVTSRLSQQDLSLYAAVRVVDPGAAFWLLSERPAKPIQLLVETGNHNIEALQGWENALAPSLERLILSIELPEEKLAEYCLALRVGCEVLGAGRILLFYSPRSLLATHVDPIDLEMDDQLDKLRLDQSQLGNTHLDKSDDDTESRGYSHAAYEQNEAFYLDAVIRPQKSLNRAFPTVETIHGTFMYLDKDQFILDRLDQLREVGLSTLRLDLRHLSQGEHSAQGIEELCQQFILDPLQLRDKWPRPTRAPFFKTNRTTAQFSRMKSPLHEQRDESCLAEIIAGDNGNYVVYQARRDFHVTQVESIVLSTGEEIDVPSHTTFQDRDGRRIQQAVADQILISGWIKKAVPGSLLRGSR
ncbi:MAG: U32 family peptidase [Chloroflexota bacterium]